MGKGWALSTGNLPRGGLPRNSVDRITDRPDMTSAVDGGGKALTQTKKRQMGTCLRHKIEEKYWTCIKFYFLSYEFIFTTLFWCKMNKQL